jgi:hypothetical protein
MNDIAVLIPYGNETPWRKRALEHVQKWYAQELENPRIQLGFGQQPWCKAKAVASALAPCAEPIVIVGDADCITPGLKQAVRAVQQGAAAWAMPHLKVYRMGQIATNHIFEGVNPGSLTGQTRWLDQHPYKGYEGGGITVMRRDVYLNCPLDPGFIGWGQEDEAWALALNGLYGPPWRGQAPLYHLWHEKPVRITRYAGSAESLARLGLYKKARETGAWDTLLKQGRELASAVSAPV